MLRTFLIFTVLLACSIQSEAKYFGVAPNRGLLIKIDKNAREDVNTSERQFTGTIELSDPKYQSEERNLLEEFQKHGLFISASYPQVGNDISSSVELVPEGKKKIRFRYIYDGIQIQSSAQFKIDVYSSKKDSKTLSNLLVIQRKIDKRKNALNVLHKRVLKDENNMSIMRIIENELNKLELVSNSIHLRVLKDENVLASAFYSPQFLNLLASESGMSTIENGFKYYIRLSPGTVIRGMPLKISGGIKSVGNLNSSQSEKSPKNAGNSNGIMNFEVKLSGSSLYSDEFQKGSQSVDIYFEKTISDIGLDQSQIEFLINSADSSSQVSISQSVFTEVDTQPPIVDLNSIPNSNHQYVKNLPDFLIKFKDTFGRLEPSSFKSGIYGHNKDGSEVQMDLGNLFSYSSPDENQHGVWQLSQVVLPEGSYTFSASVKDLAGNESALFSQEINIDNTNPTVSVTATIPNSLKETAILIPVVVSDRSPSKTSIYVNDMLFFETQLMSFSSFVSLPSEGENNVKIVSIDEAGNVSESLSFFVIRDTISPILLSLTPADGQIISTKEVPFLGSSNEELRSISVNNVQLVLSADKKSFAGIVPLSDGDNSINVNAIDLVGNVSTVNLNVSVKSQSQLHTKWAYEECPISN